MVVSSIWDLLGLPSETSGVAERLGEPGTDAQLRRSMDAQVALLSSRDAEIAWLTLPRFRPNERYPLAAAEVEAARVRYNALVRELGRRHPERVHVVDLAEAFERWPGGPFDPVLREDGVHFSRAGGVALLGDGLGDELAALATESRQRRAAAARVDPAGP